MKNTIRMILAVCLAMVPTISHAQAVAPSTNTDLFVSLGSDFDRPGVVPRANYNVSLGHTYKALNGFLLGDELTLGYTYEDAGSGFWHSRYGQHTESFGIMRNFNLAPKSNVTYYTWLQIGPTQYTGYKFVHNEFDTNVSVGLSYHVSPHSAFTLQESYNKVINVPWNTTTSVGYAYSWATK